METTEKSLNHRTKTIGKSLFERIHKGRSTLANLNKWTQEIIQWCLANKDVKNRLLRFVDVLPTLKDHKAITQHIRDYFPSSETRLPLALRGGSFISQTPFTTRAVANLTQRMTSEIAKQFICGETIKEARESIQRLEKKRWNYSIDLLGEKVLSATEANSFQKKYLDLVTQLPHRSNISIKLSSLSPYFDPLAPKEATKDVLKRLIPILVAAKKKNSFINVDMENYTVRDLTLTILKEALLDEKVKGYPHVGTVFQAYLKDCPQVLHTFLSWLRKHKQPMTLRLVKGAYWDSEVAKAKAAGWPVPVWESKIQTDYYFEKLAKELLDQRDLIRVAIASHNVRSVAYAIALHEESTFPSNTLEFQLLYGMADPLKTALVERGHTVRVYCPFGPLIPGMAYLVRRILENTSNESFLKLDLTQEISEDELLTPPKNGLAIPQVQPKEPNFSLSDFRNEPALDFSKEENRTRLEQALQDVREKLGQDYPLIIEGSRIRPDQWNTSVNPAHPKEIVGRVGRAQWNHAEQAIKAAHQAQTSWSRTAPQERAECLMRAAALVRDRRLELAAWEVTETGKTWREADADVTEAIDFLDYYARCMVQLSKNQKLLQVPGEENEMNLHGRGIAAIIAPWNFPLAILTGMTAAALVSGNAALIKPAETSSVIGYHLVDIFLEAGIPSEIIAFIPGPGSEIGKGLVEHPLVDVIAFTGSREVGLSLVQTAGQTSASQTNVKKVVAEMGGKNAIIVDDDADLDEALSGVLTSAFGYQGQKCSACSRVILMPAIYDRFMDRLVDAMKNLQIGDPAQPSVHVGPVIDLEAYKKINETIRHGKKEARLVYQGKVPEEAKGGYFVPPTLFSDAPIDGRLSQEEIFGPVLSVYRASDFDQAIELANNTAYALTAGLYSRHVSHINQAKSSLVAGNIYINRPITGAMVGRHPFGGFRMSGLGSKAGGVEYLSHFLFQTAISENTFRHGFPLE